MEIRNFDISKLTVKDIKTYMLSGEKRVLIKRGVEIATLMDDERANGFRRLVAEGKAYAPLVVDPLAKELFLDAVLYCNYLGLTPDEFGEEDFDFVRYNDYYGQLQGLMKTSKDTKLKDALRRMFNDYKMFREAFNETLNATVTAFNYETDIAKDVAVIKAAVATALYESASGETPDVAEYIKNIRSKQENAEATDTEKTGE